MAARKRRGLDPGVIRFNNLVQLCNSANNLMHEYAGNPEKAAYLKGVRDWAIQTLVDEYPECPPGWHSPGYD